MIWIGIIVAALGFALLVPAGELPGSSAGRIVPMYAQRVHTTPGHRAAPSGRPWRRRLVGLVMLAIGIVLIVVGG